MLLAWSSAASLRSLSSDWPYVHGQFVESMMANDAQLRCEVCGKVKSHQELGVQVRDGKIKGVRFKRSVTYCYDDIDCGSRAIAMAEEYVAKFEVAL